MIEQIENNRNNFFEINAQQINKYRHLMRLAGYSVNTTDLNNKANIINFYKYIDYSEYPRYHTKIELRDRFNVNLHIDINQHTSPLISFSLIYQTHDELKRIINTLKENEQSPENILLIQSFQGELLFGTSENIQKWENRHKKSLLQQEINSKKEIYHERKRSKLRLMKKNQNEFDLEELV